MSKVWESRVELPDGTHYDRFVHGLSGGYKFSATTLDTTDIKTSFFTCTETELDDIFDAIRTARADKN